GPLSDTRRSTGESSVLYSCVVSDRLLPALIITFDLPAQVEFPATRRRSQISLRAASLPSALAAAPTARFHSGSTSASPLHPLPTRSRPSGQLPGTSAAWNRTLTA